MDDTNLHAPTLRWVANMLESRVAESERRGLAQAPDEYGAIRAMRLLADGLHERADGLAKEEAPLSAWIAATEGTRLPPICAPRIGVAGELGALRLHVSKYTFVDLVEDPTDGFRIRADLITMGGSCVPCASPAELRAALEALVPR